MRKPIFLLLVALFSLTLSGQAKKPESSKTGSAVSSPAASNVYRMEEGFVDAHGVLIYYKIIGRGAPLMIVHGGPGASHDYLLPYLLPLARANRLIFIDERGSGRSEKLEDASKYTVENMVEDVEAVRQALHLGKISLLGHSYGGVLAQAYAFKYQQNLTHLILGGTFYSTSEMNKVLAEEKNAMPADELAKLNDLEKAGLFAKAKIGKRIATRKTTPSWPGVMDTFHFFISIALIQTMILFPATPPRHGTFIARCGDRMASSSLMGT